MSRFKHQDAIFPFWANINKVHVTIIYPHASREPKDYQVVANTFYVLNVVFTQKDSRLSRYLHLKSCMPLFEGQFRYRRTRKKQIGLHVKASCRKCIMIAKDVTSVVEEGQRVLEKLRGRPGVSELDMRRCLMEEFTASSRPNFHELHHRDVIINY